MVNLRRFLMKVPHWYLLAIPTILIYLGGAMNILVMGVNHAKMPVLVPGGICDPDMYSGSLIHQCMTHASHLKFLADWINLVSSQGAIASPGDMIIDLGAYLFFPAIFIWVVLMVKEHNS